MKTKDEYLIECENNDQSYKTARVFQTVFMILWFVSDFLWIIRVYQDGVYGFYDSVPILVASFILWIIWIIISIYIITKKNQFKANYEAYVLNKNKQPFKYNSLPVNNSTWVCDCGNINSSHVSYCPNCGNKARITYNKNTVASADEWLCPKCGRVNKNYVGSCGCGERKPE